jgi:hypothetical protein
VCFSSLSHSLCLSLSHCETPITAHTDARGADTHTRSSRGAEAAELKPRARHVTEGVVKNDYKRPEPGLLRLGGTRDKTWLGSDSGLRSFRDSGSTSAALTGSGSWRRPRAPSPSHWQVTEFSPPGPGLSAHYVTSESPRT